MTNDFKGRNFTASITTVNNDIVQNSGIKYIFMSIKTLFLISFIKLRSYYRTIFTKS
jgi:hypothetical protein